MLFRFVAQKVQVSNVNKCIVIVIQIKALQYKIFYDYNRKPTKPILEKKNTKFTAKQQ